MKVHGRVQGVGFRFYTQQQADRHNVKGWVQNRPDGTVDIDAEGDPHDTEQFIEAVKKGSLRSKVTAVDTEEISETVGYTSFQIRH